MYPRLALNLGSPPSTISQILGLQTCVPMNGFMYKVFKDRNDPENIYNNTRQTEQLDSEASRSASNRLSRGVRCLLGRAISRGAGCYHDVERGKGRSQTKKKGTVQWSLLSLAH